jgi:hypothetical protein
MSKIPLGDARSIPGQFEFVFAVTNVWKGAAEDTLRVRSGSDGGMCGQDFQVGLHYFVYASYYEDRLRTSLCQRNQPVDQALWDRFALPEPRPVNRAWPMPKLSRDDLFERMNRGTETESYGAALALGGSSEIRADVMPDLRQISRKARPGNAAAAAFALGRMREAGRPAEPELAWLQVHGNAPERAIATRALSDVMDYRSYAPYLFRALSDSSGKCLLVALDDIGQLLYADSLKYGKPAEKRVVELLRHSDPEVRMMALASLHYFPRTARALMPQIETMSQEDTSYFVRHTAWAVTYNLLGQEPGPEPHR